MGSAVSATAADRRAAEKTRKRRQQHQLHKQRRLLAQLPRVDEEGNALHYDKHGNQFFYDQKRRAYYLDEKGQKFHIDEFGNAFYYDEKDEPFYLSKDGDRLYVDDRSEIIPNADNKPSHDSRNLHHHNNNQSDSHKLNGTLHDPADIASPALIITSERGRRETNGSNPSTASTAIQFKTKNDTPALYMGEEIAAKPTCSAGKPNPSNATNERITHTEWDRSLSRMSTNSFLEAITTPATPSSFDPRTDTLSPYSSLSFVSSSFNREALVTPDYIKDDSEEAEYKRSAQTEAENRVLKKLLEKEKDKLSLPAMKSYRKVGEFNVKEADDSCQCFISGSDFLSNGHLVLADYRNMKIKLFDQELEHISSLKIDTRPESLCCGKNDNLVHVIFRSSINNGLAVFEVKDTIILEKNLITLPWQPGGISRSKKGLAIMQNCNGSWKIHLTDLNARVLQVVNLDDQTVSKPVCVAITTDLNFIIADRGNNSVLGYNMKGEELFVYRQLREPMSVCLDYRGSVFVTSPGVVHQISEQGDRIGALMKRESTKFAPANCCYDPTDGLFVLSGQSDMIVAFEFFFKVNHI